MTNPLKTERAKPVKRTLQEWADYGNAHLASIGRDDVHWFITRHGELMIGYVHPGRA